MLELAGNLAVVTGGASGIGAEVCSALAGRGVRVASLDLADGGPAELQFRCDIADEASLDAAMAAAVSELGGLHYAVINAGVAGMGSVLGMSSEEWDRVNGIDLRGSFLSLQRAARAIRRTGAGGAIVVTASSAAMVADMGFVHYSVAKAGLRQLVAVAARELGTFGIRVNAVAPGPTNTPMSAPTADIPGFHDAMSQRTPLGRMGEPDDIAEAVLGLLGMRWVTGQTLAVDGGLTLVAGTDFPGLTAEMIAEW